MTKQTDVWLAWLRSHVGDTESPPGSNCCPICREYGNLGVNCYAWCCATQDLALEHTFGTRLLGTASVGMAKSRAQQGINGLLWIPRVAIENGEDLRVGDLCCWDYGGHGNWNDFHIGGIVNPYTNKRFQSIDGNRQNRCDYFWNTLNSSLMGVIRPPFTDTGLGAPPSQGEDDMSAAGEAQILKMLEAQGEAIARLEDHVYGSQGIEPIVTQIRGGLLPQDATDKPLGVSSVDNQLKEIRRNVRKTAAAAGVPPDQIEH